MELLHPIDLPRDNSEGVSSAGGLAGSGDKPRCEPAAHDLAALLRAALGARWSLLHPHIQARFELLPGEAQAEYVGNMHQVRCTWLGGVFARLIRHARILPHQNADEVPFRFDVRPMTRGLGWVKTRTYHFVDEVFSFRSRMILGDNGELLEHFGGGLGMRVRLEVLPNRLVFVDDGYFLHWRGLRLPLPKPLWPGRFVLVHRDLDAEHFEVSIDVEHPWFGPLFHQDGSFERMRVQEV
ncbi:MULTISPECIES: DUF4166 domain-containing protein [Lysobacter]|jgi:hypothetical protein|uniref:DUF4166 domain-containing protein n=1 Tax=Lysobacter gummosus TaxID=262324 RepID=A0ABY3XJ40_9GAMM|nr:MULTISPECIES: DUF4166 domain-containing protein [Lysobacter]ALN91225.1 hypothetical protein LG3211_2258 [Lysobacter gummosus]UJB21697.1 DUF4166 domain-containing protein [Lysobacter capsici]UJQ29186.1 DUF4166 domain-containing protein [Lysobacter gummosus]UNP31631.1 DUF4166 domain-containing protein [Lysobacter gummosus]